MCRDGQHAKQARAADLLRSGRLLVDEGRLDEAMETMQQLLREDPDNVDALRCRGAIFLELGNACRALAEYDQAISLEPGCADCYFERGTAYLRCGNMRAALVDFSICLSMNPVHAPSLASRAALLLRAGRYEEAYRDITSAAAKRPLCDRDVHNRAVVLTHLGRVREAIREYERALKLNPRSGGTHSNLAWLLATSGDPNVRDGKRALEHALRAVELGRNSAWVDTLAAAYAECGDFEAAVRAEEDACGMSGYGNDAFLRRLKLYRRGVSYAAWREARRHNEDL
jgi:tetratricopeptide (TPR) repeat protein